MKFSPVLLLLLGAPCASAEVVYSGLWNIPIPLNFDGVYLDIDTGMTASVPAAGWDINFFFGGVGIAASANFQPARYSPGNEDPVQRLDAGTLIGPDVEGLSSGEEFSGNRALVTTTVWEPGSGEDSAPDLHSEFHPSDEDSGESGSGFRGSGDGELEPDFGAKALMVATLQYAPGESGSFGHLGAPGNFEDGVEGYLGFRFMANDNSGPYYGWMRVTLTANTPGAVIHDWAWETSGGGIAAGQVPEPTGAASMLAVGLGALFRRRTRR